VYDVWIVIELIVVYFFYIETRYTPLEEIAKHFDGEVSTPYKPYRFRPMLTSHRTLLLEVAPLPRSLRSLPLRWVASTPLTSVRSAQMLRPKSTRCQQHFRGATVARGDCLYAISLDIGWSDGSSRHLIYNHELKGRFSHNFPSHVYLVIYLYIS